ncbi:MAG: GNAT family N-acetyltransferase [Bryobacterales bacterium]|nr:GNAT family N-acetyltransferase [Bryobacterales bacterium]
MPEAIAAAATVQATAYGEGDYAAWEAFVEAHPRSNIYHSLAWKAVTEEGLGHRAIYLKAVDGGGSIRGVLPLFLIKGIAGRRLVSVPMRDRGGLLTLDRASARALLAEAVRLSRELRCAYLELRSLDEFDPELASEFGLAVSRHWVTTRVDLSAGVDRLWKALDRDAIRWAINKATRGGMTFEDDQSQAGIDLFYGLFVRTRTGMGIPPFPRNLFTAIWQHLISKGKARLFVVRQKGMPVHAMINFLSGDTFIPAYAAPQNEWRKSYPNEFMFWHTIRWAAEQGFRYYDFGADSPRQAGLLQFKRKWGGVPHPVSYVFHLNGRSQPPNFDSSSGSYDLVRKVWRRFPLPLSRALGAWATRQLS